MTFSPLRAMLGKLRFVFAEYASGDFSPLRVMLGKLRFVFAEYVSGDFFTAPSNARKTASCVTLSRFEKPNYPASSNVVHNVNIYPVALTDRERAIEVIYLVGCSILWA